MRISHLATTLLIGMLLIVWAFNIGPADASPSEQLADLTGKASVSVTLTGRDNFNSEYRYDLTVRNRSSDPSSYQWPSGYLRAILWLWPTAN